MKTNNRCGRHMHIACAGPVQLLAREQHRRGRRGPIDRCGRVHQNGGLAEFFHRRRRVRVGRALCGWFAS